MYVLTPSHVLGYTDSYWYLMRALLSCASWVDIIEIALYVIVLNEINDDDDNNNNNKLPASLRRCGCVHTDRMHPAASNVDTIAQLRWTKSHRCQLRSTFTQAHSMYIGVRQNVHFYYSAPQSIALQTLYMLRHICLSVLPSSVTRRPVLYQHEEKQRDAVFTVG